MAIDSENKRRSTLAVLPAPDATIADVDRRQVTWNYSGIVTAAVAAVARRWTSVSAVSSTWLGTSARSTSWVSPASSTATWVGVANQEQD